MCIRDSGNRVSSDNLTEISVRLFQGTTSVETLVSFVTVSNGRLTLGDLTMNQAGNGFYLRASGSNNQFGISSTNSVLFDVFVP